MLTGGEGQLAAFEALEIKIPVIDFKEPPSISVDKKWFQLDTIDRDNLKFHLESTPGMQALLSQLYAEAKFFHTAYYRLAKRKEAETRILYKTRPYNRMLAKSQDWELADGSDDFAKACSEVNEEAVKLRNLAALWEFRQDVLRGYLDAFETKRTFLASLSGITRSEMDATNRER